jgi:hypothetical protein
MLIQVKSFNCITLKWCEEEPVLLPRRLANYKEIEDYVISFILGGLFQIGMKYA